MTKLNAKELFDNVQPYDQYNDTHVYYFVQAGQNFEVFACERDRLDLLEEKFNFVRVETNQLTPLTSQWAWPTQLPVLKSVDDTHSFPHHEWQRTTYSLGGNSCNFISEMSYQELQDWLNYVFWESSDEFLAKHGMPTNEDCQIWIRYIHGEKKLDIDEKRHLVSLIEDFLDPAQ